MLLYTRSNLYYGERGKKSMNQYSDESLDLVVQEIMMIRECSASIGLDCKRLLACEAVGHGDR